MSTTASGMGASGAALLALTAVSWLVLILYLFGVVDQQTAVGDAVVGKALSYFAALIAAGFTWLWIGGLLLKAGAEGRMPAWPGVVAVILYLASALAAASSFYLLQDSKIAWPAFIPVLIPAILAAYFISLYAGSVENAGSFVAWGMIAILSVAPWPAALRKLTADSAQRSEQAKGMTQWKAREAARNRELNLVKLQAMSADARVMDWYPLLAEDSGVRPDALEALKHVDRRQADIEDMLSYGVMRAMILLPDLDLKSTPELCAKAGDFMVKAAKEWRVGPRQDPRPYSPGTEVDQCLPAIRWLLAHGCHCEDGIAALEASTQTFIPSPERDRAIAALQELRRK